MGFISEFVKANGDAASAARDNARRSWREVFAVSKEEGGQFPQVRPTPGGSYARSVVSSDAAVKRLLQALRSMAPGGWSDNRYEQQRHFVSIQYICIHRSGEQLMQAEYQLYQLDPSHPDGKRPIYPDDSPQGNRNVRPWGLVDLLQKPNPDDTFGDLMYCFPAGTKVRMANGTWKPIEKIRLCDEVVTAEGSARKVCQLHTHKHDGDLVRLCLWGHRHLRMTPSHKLLTRRGYVEVDKLTKDDWVALPRSECERHVIIQTAEHIRGEQVETKAFYPDKSYGRTGKLFPSTGGVSWANYKKIPDFIALTPGVGRIFGLFLAEGHLEPYSIVWSFGSHERDTLVVELVDLLRQEWGLEASTHVVNEFGTVTQVKIHGKLWTRLFLSLCGKGAAGKKLHPDLLAGSNEFLASLFYGWADGDGCLKKDKLCVTTVSHDLALGMFDIANRLGWRPAILRAEPNPSRRSGKWAKIQSRRPTWTVFLKSEKDNYRVELESTVMWRRVQEVSHEPFEGDVFDIGVEGQHSYIAEGIGVHNSWNQQLDLTGMALTWMVPNQLGYPFELYPIPTAIAIPQPAVNPDYPDGYYRIQPVYPYGPFSSYPTPASAVGAAIPAQWMLRFKYTHPLLRYDGYSPQSAMRFHLDEIEMIDRSRHYAMRRGIHPSAVLNMDNMEGSQPLPYEEILRIKSDFEETQMGPENFGNLFVAAPGSKLEEFGQRPVDMDYQAGWEQLVAFAMAGFGTTKSVSGMVDDASYATLFAALKQFHTMTLQPKCNRIAAKVTRHLAPFFGDNLILEIRPPRIDDHEIARMKVETLIQARAMTKNEARKELDLPLTEEEWGNEIAGVDTRLEKQIERDIAMERAGEEEGLDPDKATTRKVVGASLKAEGEDGDERLFDREVNKDKPKPTGEGRGSLGPRKFLKGLHLNGNGKK